MLMRKHDERSARRTAGARTTTTTKFRWGCARPLCNGFKPHVAYSGHSSQPSRLLQRTSPTVAASGGSAGQRQVALRLMRALLVIVG